MQMCVYLYTSIHKSNPGNMVLNHDTTGNSCSYVKRWKASVMKVGVVDVDVRISSYLKEELAWAVDKRLRVISTIMLFKE